jgi:hypothetical protein
MPSPTKAAIHPHLRPILFGLVLFLLFNVVLTAGVTFSPLNPKFNFSYGNYLPTKLNLLKRHHPEKLDVLFLGTSQTNNGFIPSVFENGFEKASGQPINSFNLGLPNNRYDIMQSYLQAHVRHYGKPRLVLVELGPSIQEKNAYFYYLPALYYRTLIEREPALAAQWLSNPLLAWNVKKELFLSAFSSLHQYRFTFSPINILGKIGDKLKILTERLTERHGGSTADAASIAPPAPTQNVSTQKATQASVQAIAKTDDDDAPASTRVFPEEMTAKGWYPKEQSRHMQTPDGVQQSVEEARLYYIAHQQGVYFDKLQSLLAYCRTKHIPVVLVSWPNHPAFNRVFRESALSRRYASGLRQLLTRNPVPVINLNHDIPATQTESQGGLFADPRHLTPEGAQFFSRKLALAVFSLPQLQAQVDHSGPLAR